MPMVVLSQGWAWCGGGLQGHGAAVRWPLCRRRGTVLALSGSL